MDTPQAPAERDHAETVRDDGEVVPADGRRPYEAVRCLVCAGCTGCGQTKKCLPCVCSGVDGLQTAVCDRGGEGHGGRRYTWIASTARHGDILLQQYCERHLLLGKKRAEAAGIAHWVRTPWLPPAAWIAAV